MIKKVLVVIKFIGFYSRKHRENKREVGRLEREGGGVTIKHNFRSPLFTVGKSNFNFYC